MKNLFSTIVLLCWTSSEALNTSKNTPKVVSRKSFLSTAFVGAASSLVVPSVAFAAGTAPPTKEELDRIKVGYEQIRYLLDNFDKETTICREGGGKECKRDAEPVRRYLGLRSTTDPLFQIEKVFDKVKYMDQDIDLESFFEATEKWNTAQNMSNSMAFISQFGEYNPGGGKDEVLKYLNESKKQVILAEEALKTIIECLNSLKPTNQEILYMQKLYKYLHMNNTSAMYCLRIYISKT